jgi:tetratricopeptide (TPR) repeat protein
VLSRRDAAAAAVLFVLVAATFAPALRNGFADIDDPEYVTENAHVRAGLSLPGFAWAAGTTAAANWHPLTWVSHMADVSLFGLDPRGHHATSVGLHAAATALFYLALSGMTGRTGASFFAAALFGVHPLRVESVAWVAERKDVLSVAFAMATLLAYAAYARRPAPRRLAAVSLLYLCGLLAKPMLVTLPLALLLLDAWPLGRLRRPSDLGALLREKTPLLLLAAASCVATLTAQSHGRAVASLEVLPLATRLANAAVSVLVYLGQLAWPSKLAFFYPHAAYTGAPDLAPWRVAAAVVVIAALSAIAWRQRCGRPYLAVGWAWYLIALVPVLGIVQVGAQAHADRYTYLPSVGPVIAAVWALDETALRRGETALRAAAVAGAIAVAALCAVTVRDVGLWREPRTLYEHALAVTERNYVAHNNLGTILAKEGKLAEAQAHFEQAVRVCPGYAEGEDNLGTCLLKAGRAREAIAHFEAAAASAPLEPMIHNNLGNALIAAGSAGDGMKELGEAIRLDPAYATAHFNLAMALARAGHADEALEHFDAAIRYAPDQAEAWANRGLLRATLGRKQEAASDYREALRLRPGWPDVERALRATEE